MQDQREFNREIYHKYFSKYISLGYKGIKLKGSQPKYNPTNDYDIGKEPISKAYTKQEYQSPNVPSLIDHIEQDGEVGWLVAPNRHVVDTEDKYTIKAMDVYCNGLRPPYEDTKNGRHWTFSTTKEIKGGTKVYTRNGFALTYKLAGKGYVIQTPSRGNTWTNEDVLDNPPLLPEDPEEFRKDNQQDLLNCIGYEVHRLKINETWGKYEELLGLSVFLIKLGISDDAILGVFEIIFGKDYDSKKTTYFLDRAHERIEENEPLIGSGTFFASIKDKDLDVLKSFALHLERLKGKSKEKTQSPLREKIVKLSKLSPNDVLRGILKEIADERDEFERTLLINAVYEKTKINRKQLQGEIENINADKLEFTDDVILVHPAYDVNESGLNLGFKITTIKGNHPVNQNIYLLDYGGEWKLYGGAVLELDGKKYVFDNREREPYP